MKCRPTSNDWQTTARFADLQGKLSSLPAPRADTARPHLDQHRHPGEPEAYLTLHYEPEFRGGYTAHPGMASLSVRF